jgi:osmotically inducible protein OsmC
VPTRSAAACRRAVAGSTSSAAAEALGDAADVSLGPDPAGGFRITGIALKVRGEVSGLDEAGFLQAAQDAKATCPVSKALTGTEITLDAALD